MKTKDELLKEYFRKANEKTQVGEHLFHLNMLLAKILKVLTPPQDEK